MAEGTLDMKFYGDAAHIIKEQAKLIKQQNESLEAYKKMGAESKKAGKESEKAAKDAEKAQAVANRELEKFAKATKDINRTPLEKYADQMLRLNQALKAGRIDQETFNRAASGAKKEFDAAGKSANVTFGSAMVAKVGTLGTAITALAPAVDIFKNAMTEAFKEADEAANRLRGDAPGLSELSQLANTPEELATMEAGAKRIYLSGATKSLGEAGQLEYTINSASMAKWRDEIAELQASGTVLNMESMVKGAGALEASMGEKETGGFIRLVSKAFGAGADSPARAEEILLSASKIAAPAKEIGLSDEDVLAAIATYSKEVGTSEEAGTGLKALFAGIAKSEIPKQTSLKGYVGYLSGLEKKGEDLRAILGDSQEAMSALASLRDSGERYDTNFQKIKLSDNAGIYTAKVNLYRSSPTQVAAREDRKSMARKVVAQEDEAQKAILAESVQNDLNAKMYDEDVGPVRRYIKNKVMEGRRGRLFWGASSLTGGSDAAFLQSFGPLGSGEMQSGLRDFSAAHQRAADTINAAANNLRDATSEVQSNMTNAVRANASTAGGAVEAR